MPGFVSPNNSANIRSALVISISPESSATHAFDYDKFQKEKFSKWGWRGLHPDFKSGFGRQVLGETWVDHYGG